MRFRKIIIVLTSIAVIFALSCSKKEPSKYDFQLLINSAKKVDDILHNELQRLKIIAENEEVISGDWQSIKKALTENSSKRIKALYWYSLPDGSYYTSAQDKVEANLSDREYFQSLKKGNNVVGYPIIGKTSGKKSFVIAVPIIKEEEVVGMLGSSVFLNEFWNYLKEQIKIPSDYDFYTIAADGITIFDLESKDLMLNDTLEESSTSLVAAVEEIISKKDGIVTYEWNEKEKTAIFTKSHVCDWRYVLSYID